MKLYLTLVFLLTTFSGTIASASIIDFRTASYASTFGNDTTTDSIDGVNFTITATARGVNGFRQNFGSSGLSFGVPGNGMFTLSIVADADVEYTSLFGRGHVQTTHAGQLPFDISVNGLLQNDNIMFVPSIFTSVSLGSLLVNQGDALLIGVDYTALSGSTIFANAVLQALNFVVPASSSVPNPSTILLLMVAIPGLLGARRHRQLKVIA